MRMPKLLQINVTCNWGSTGKIAELIGQEAISRGWKSYIAYGRYENDSESEKIKIGSKSSVYLHYLSQRIFDNEGLCSNNATRKLIKRINEIQPDIIQLHNIHDHFLNYRLLFDYLNQTDIKVVWTMHDFWAVTGHCMHFISANCGKFMTGCGNCPMRKVYPKSLIDRSDYNYHLKRKLFNNNDNLNVVAVSEWVGDMLRTSCLKDKPISVINNGIDLSVFKPTENEGFKKLVNDKFVILSVASQWKQDKGLEDYKTLSSLLDEDEIIVLAGVDDKTISELPHNIIGIKRTENAKELAGLYTRADVVTILSTAETFGLTVVEGYACGTPAVVYNNTAPPALITPDTGFVAENLNPIAVYDAIKKIRAKGKEHYIQQCISLAKDKYDRSRCSRNYLEFYEDLLSKG